MERDTDQLLVGGNVAWGRHGLSPDQHLDIDVNLTSILNIDPAGWPTGSPRQELVNSVVRVNTQGGDRVQVQVEVDAI